MAVAASFMLAGAILAAIEFMSISSEHDFLERSTHREIARTLAPEVQELLDRRAGISEFLQLADRISAVNPDLGVFILDSTGTIALTLSPTSTVDLSHIDPRPLQRCIDGGDCPELHVDPCGSKRGKIALVPFSVAPLRLDSGSGFLYATIQGSSLYARARGVARENALMSQGVLMLLLTFGAALGIVATLLMSISHRFRALRIAAKHFRDGRFQHRIAADGSGDEVEQLSQALNVMAETVTASLDDLGQRDEFRRALIAAVSSDLRPSLQAITNVTSELGAKVRDIPAAPEAVEAPVRSLQSSVPALKQMLDELDALSEVESHADRLALIEVPVGALIEELIEQFSPEARSKQVTLTADIQEPLPQPIADRLMIARLLGNLIGNALRYSPAGTAVVVSARKSPRGVLLRVSDGGVGISEEELPRLFERYYRGESSRPAATGSTGLGLAIVKRIIELHRTSISVESSKGKGTSFSFELLTRGAGGEAPSYSATQPESGL